MASRKLPAGIQTFREIREGGFYYVDKTAFAQRLVAHPLNGYSIFRASASRRAATPPSASERSNSAAR